MDQRRSVDRARVEKWLDGHANSSNAQLYKAFPDYAKSTLRKYRAQNGNALLAPAAPDPDPQGSPPAAIRHNSTPSPAMTLAAAGGASISLELIEQYTIAGLMGQPIDSGLIDKALKLLELKKKSGDGDALAAKLTTEQLLAVIKPGANSPTVPCPSTSTSAPANSPIPSAPSK